MATVGIKELIRSQLITVTIVNSASGYAETLLSDFQQ